MSETREAADLAEAKALRDEAWGLVRGEVTRVREGLATRSIPRRIKDRATGEVVDAVDQARDIASEHKAIVAGTVLALVGWFLREPLQALIGGLIDHLRGDDAEHESDDAGEPGMGDDTSGDDA